MSTGIRLNTCTACDATNATTIGEPRPKTCRICGQALVVAVHVPRRGFIPHEQRKRQRSTTKATKPTKSPKGRPIQNVGTRYCEHCGQEMQRRRSGKRTKRWPLGRLEGITAFRKRRFCSPACFYAAGGRWNRTGGDAA